MVPSLFPEELGWVVVLFGHHYFMDDLVQSLVEIHVTTAVGVIPLLHELFDVMDHPQSI